MKTAPLFFKIGLPLAVLLSALLLCQTAAAAVTFSATPSAVSNTYLGYITLQITGLTNGEPVKIGKHVDFNGNGAVDPEDFRVQAFNLTNGQANIIGGVTNINVPGDWDTSTNSILVPMNFAGAGFEQQLVGSYVFRLISPSGNFTPISIPFTVTNSAFVQSLSGTVVTGGTTPVPYAEVMLFSGAAFNSYPIGGALADSSGNYAIKVAPGTYSLVAFKSNYVVDLTAAPVVTLAPGDNRTNNLGLLPATTSISGNARLPAVFLGAQSANHLMAIGFTDTNGNFTLPVTAGQWGVFIDSAQPALYGLLGWDSNLPADTTTTNATGVTFNYALGTALFYGSVKDGQNQPLAGVRLEAQQNGGNGLYRASAVTDQNGKYVLAVTADIWEAEINHDDPGFSGYVFSQGSGNISFTNGRVVQQNFVALLATNHITGHVSNNTLGPIANVEVYFQGSIGSTNYTAPNVYTDNSGYYSNNVANGTWTVGVQCSGDRGLQPLGYQCVENQTTNILNNNAVVNFTVAPPPSHIAIYVRATNNIPIPNVGVYANNINGGPNNPGGITDANGLCRLDVQNGSWTVGVSCIGNSVSLNELGYLCVNEQMANVTNSTVTNHFFTIPAPYHISGSVSNTFNNPVANLGVYAWATLNGTNYGVGATTDSGGHYSFHVANGPWNVGMNCSDTWSGSLYSLGYLCTNDEMIVVSNSDRLVNLTVQPHLPLHITTTSLPDGTLGQPYSQQLLATGGQPPLLWGANPIFLPPGLDLGSDGLISGVPTTVGTFNFSVQAYGASPYLDSTNQPLVVRINSVSTNVGPQLTAPTRLQDGEFQFTFDTNPGVNYTIQYSTTLTNWLPILTFNSPGGTLTITDPNAPHNSRCFYRVKAGP